MQNRIQFNSFQDFWPAYLRAHSSAASRACHFAGLVLGLSTAVALVSCGMFFFLALAVVPPQVGAWLGHRLSFRRGPDVVGEHPEWAVLADLKMFGLALTGRLSRELDRVREASAPSHPAWV
jgi:hypothetical protein